MPKVIRALTNTEVEKAKPKDKMYELRDGNNLVLRIRPNGTKIWYYTYKRPNIGKYTMVSFGKYPYISIADARQRREEYRTMLAKGIDPQEKAQAEEEEKQIAHDKIFINVAKAWMEVKKSSITADYAVDIWRSLEKDILPYLKDTSIDDIKPRLLIEILQPVRVRGALETVRRLIQRLNEIMIYATNTGLIDSNPAYGIANAFEKPKREFMKTIRPEELPKLVNDINMSNLAVTTRCLIFWQLLTMTRPSEAANTEWKEIDFEKRLWTIPAARMKAKREHIIPLSDEALAVIEVLRPMNGHRQFVFASRTYRWQSIDQQTANMALKRIGYEGKLVAHGMRSIASTAMNEAGFNPDVIEAALAHVDKNDVRRAYNRATYLEQRRELMEWWGKKVYERG